MPLIVGLGNPGTAYDRTRHNVGYKVVDEIAHQLGWSFANDRQANALVAEGNIDGKKIILAKPQTFMNLSGNAVASLAARYGFAPSDIWITYDDAMIELGVLRVRSGGSAGGHNGMKSIITSLASEAFPRFRIGIGAPPERVALEDYVLGKITSDEQKIINETVKKAATTIVDSLHKGIVETTQ
ncbi:MAG: aminoacyl-tRNA hydrolase [Candidatus Uhrbacteria bacterium]|nr:aminoacyl-tRNA hydrolase [Candidatus Uhrbacteria bacterium]